MKVLVLIFFLFSGYAYATSIESETSNYNLNHWINKGYKITSVNSDSHRGIIYTLRKSGLAIGDDGFILTNVKIEVILCHVDILNKITKCHKP